MMATAISHDRRPCGGGGHRRPHCGMGGRSVLLGVHLAGRRGVIPADHSSRKESASRIRECGQYVGPSRVRDGRRPGAAR
jgi:hypothetical protein